MGDAVTYMISFNLANHPLAFCTLACALWTLTTDCPTTSMGGSHF